LGCGTVPRGERALFRNRFVRVLLLSALFLQIGVWVRNLAVLMYVMEKTGGDAVAVSLVQLAEYAPIFLFSFVGGTFADRWRPKRTMVGCDLTSALFAFLVLPAMERISWTAALAAVFVSSVLSQFSQPAGMRLFKRHVPEKWVQTGMSLYQTLIAAFMIAGPILGTMVYESFGIEAAVAVMGAAFLASACVLAFLPPDSAEDGSRSGSVLADMAAGFRYVRANRVLMLLGGHFASAGLALGLIQPLTVFVVTEKLGLPKEQLQWLLAANGVAMLIGGALTAGWSRKIAPETLLLVGALVSSLSVLTIGLSTNLGLTLLAEFSVGLVLPGIQVGIATLVLRSTEADFVGRVNGILNPLFMGTMVATMAVSGWLKERLSLEPLFLAATVLFCIGALFVFPLFAARRAPDASGDAA